MSHLGQFQMDSKRSSYQVKFRVNKPFNPQQENKDYRTLSMLSQQSRKAEEVDKVPKLHNLHSSS